MDERFKKKAVRSRPAQIPRWLVALVIFSLLTMTPLLLRYHFSRVRGDPWPPAPVWQGTGILHTSNGYGHPLYLKLRFERKHEGFGPADGKANLIGTASICSDENTPLDLGISGSLDAWWFENGKAVTLYFRTEKNANPRLYFLLYGSWQGTELVLEDRGTFAHFSKPDADINRRAKPPTTVANTQITLHYGEKGKFEELCSSAT